MADGVIGIRITGDATGLQQSLQGASGSVREFSDRIKDSASSMDSLANGLKSAFMGSSIAVGIIGLKNTLGEFTQALIQAQIQADKLRNGLNFAVGRSNSAGEIDFIRSSAKNLGLEFVTTAAQYTKLAAAARGTGLQGQKVRDVFTSIAQASTVMGLSAQETEAALLAVTQMISKGKVQAEELRGQLGERLPGAFQIAAEAMGVTTGELDKMLQTGNVLTEDFLPKFAAVLTRKTAPEVAAAAQSMQASVNLMSNAWTEFKQTFAEGSVASGLSGFMRGIAIGLGGISENLQVVKASGGGFFRQFIQLTGDTLATFLPLVDAPRTLAVQLDLANKKVVSLQKSMNGADAYQQDWLRKEIASTQDWIVVLAEAIAKKRELANGPGGNNQSSAEDRRLAESASAESARKTKIKAQQDGLKAAMGTYATPTENLNAELKKQKDLLGDLFTPDLERRIREHFIKPVSDTSDAAKGLKLHMDLIGKAGGFSADYQEKNIQLAAAFAKGNLTLPQLTADLKELNAEQEANKKIAKAWADQAKESAHLVAESVKDYDKYIEDLKKSGDAIEKQAQKMQDEETALKISEEKHVSLAQAIEMVNIARLDSQILIEKAAGNQEAIDAVKEEILQRERLIKLIGDKDARTASEAAAKKASDDWKKTADQIESSITDALMRGFENSKDFATNFRDTVVNMFKTMVLRPIVSAIVSPVAGALTGAMGLSGAANAASAVNGAAAATNGASMLSGLGSWFTNFGESATSALYSAGEKVYSMGFESLGKSMMGNINEAGGFTAMADKLQMVGDGLGYLNATMLAAGGQWGAAIGAGIGTLVGGPLGSIVGQAVGGWVDNAFGGGHEYTTGTGLTGKFSKAGFSGRNYQDWRNDGSSGLFGIGGSGSSSGRNYSGMSQGATDQLSAGFASIQFAAAAMAVSLGLNAQKVIDFTKDITVALSGDAEANKKVITDLMTGIANDIAATVAPTIADFAKDGETASTTLARLSASIITANSWLSMLKQRLFQVSLAGGDAASRLADAFGGLDQLSASSKAFYDTYYTNAEKVSASQEAMTNALKDYGIALPTSKAALRDLVDAMDLNSQAGREAYATLLKLAPQFAETAALMDQMATDAAASLVKAFTANGELVPALEAAALSMTGIQDGVDVFVGGISQVHAVMLDTNSPVISFNGYISSLSTGLTDAQASALLLQDQITALGTASGKAVIDFDGLSSALSHLDTATFVSVITTVFDKLATRISSTIDAITAERVAVREAALQIVNPTVMSKQSIQAGIKATNITLPGNTGLISANAALAAANSAQTIAKDNALAMGANVVNAQGILSAAQAYAAALPATFNAARDQLYNAGNRHDIRVNSNSISGGAPDRNNTAYQYDANTNRLSSYDYITYWGHGLSEIAQFRAEYGNAVAVLDTANAAFQQSEVAVANAQATLNSASSASNAANLSASNATAAQAAAAKAAAKSLLDYQASMQGFAIDASKSVTRLSKLREETVKYYDAQKALSDLMGTSAATLRTSVANYRYSQLTPEAQAASLQAQFATAYSMAQASQGDGTMLASYADKLNNTLSPLIDKLNETGQSSLITNYLAQAEAVAKLLEDNAPKSYQADSLAMLGDIDTTLAALDASAQSAEKIIADAIAAGSDRTAAGLHAVIAAITGQSVPAFATGAAFSRGGSVIKRPSLFNMGQMAETGPEAIMPLANINGSLGVRVSGGSDAMVQELRALRQEVVNLRAESQATAIATGKTAKLLDGVVRGGDSINTVAAV